MNYLKRVIAPFKGGVDVELGYRTLVLGDNKSGKSAITSAAEFLLTGRASQIMGRQTVADVNTLLTLGPGEELWAKGVLSNGQEIALAAKGKKVPPAPYPNALPLRDVKEALAGSVETVRKFFLRMVGGAVSKQDILGRIPSPYQELYALAISSTPLTMPPVDQLLHALARSKSRARDLLAEARASSTVTTDISSNLEPVSNAALADARAALSEARAKYEAVKNAAYAATRLQEAQQALMAAQARRDELQAQLAHLTPPAEADRVRENALEVTKFAEKHKLTTCPCCRADLAGADVDFWTSRTAAFQTKADARKAELADYHHLNAAFEAAQRAVEQAGDEVNRTAQIPGAMAHADVDSAVVQAAEAEAQAAEERVIELERASAGWEQAKRARDAAAERALEAQRWANLADACKQAVSELLDQSTDAFVARVQKHLPASSQFALTLHEDDREVCHYGYLRDGHLDMALSGAEWTTLGAALAAAYMESSPSGTAGEPTMIIPDDCGWSATVLTETLKALEAAPCQVILATTIPEGFVPPEGWTVIWTSGGPRPVARIPNERVEGPPPERAFASTLKARTPIVAPYAEVTTNLNAVEQPAAAASVKRGRKKKPVEPPPGIPPELE